MKDYNKLVEAIQKAVPEIMELKFGCKVKHNNDILRVTFSWEKQGKKLLDCITEDNMNTQLKNYEGNIEILGRDINLDDVLKAIKMVNTDVLVITSNWDSGEDKVRILIDDGDNKACYWELGKPLHLQKPEVIEFLNKFNSKEMKLEELKKNESFIVNNILPNGFFKDDRLLKVDNNNTIWIWLRDSEEWVNAPQEKGMVERIILQIEKYGVLYN